MNINSREFELKHKEMIEYGFCKKCIAILTSPWTIGKECKKCSNLIKRIYDKNKNKNIKTKN